DQWWEANKARYPNARRVVINLDNGPENSSHRTQFINRMVMFADATGLEIKLVYYPPYHSKYNPIEHCWGILEQHWNGDLLDEVEAVRGFARSMTWNGKHPVVELLSAVYEKGVRLSAKEMEQVEKEVNRLPNLGKWFVDIH